jgi:enoyl-CoA hydratase
MSGLLLVQCQAGILTVTLNRSEKRNALSRALIAEIGDVFNRWKERDDVVLAVLTGSGDKAFASGGDLTELAAVRSIEAALAFAIDTRAALDNIRRFPVPVIAALNGDALGGGAELALACDMRIAARHTRIGFLQGSLNISTAWGGGTDLFQLLASNRALYLLCAAEALDATSARWEGLLDDVAANDNFAEFVAAYVSRFSRRKPQVMRAFKSLAIQHRYGADYKDKAAAESAFFAQTWVHEDHWGAPGATGVRGA